MTDGSADRNQPVVSIPGIDSHYGHDNGEQFGAQGPGRSQHDQATSDQIDQIHRLIRGLRMASWDEISPLIRLRLPSRVSWIVTRSRSSDGLKTAPARASSSEPSVVETVKPFLDLGHSVISIDSGLMHRWRRSPADVYRTAIVNLRSTTSAALHFTGIRSCRIAIVDAGYWTTGLAIDFEYLFAHFQANGRLEPNLQTEMPHTLVLGENYIIWCLDHGARIQPNRYCTVHHIGPFLNQLAKSPTTHHPNSSNPARIL